MSMEGEGCHGEQDKWDLFITHSLRWRLVIRTPHLKAQVVLIVWSCTEKCKETEQFLNKAVSVLGHEYSERTANLCTQFCPLRFQSVQFLTCFPSVYVCICQQPTTDKTVAEVTQGHPKILCNRKKYMKRFHREQKKEFNTDTSCLGCHTRRRDPVTRAL